MVMIRLAVVLGCFALGLEASNVIDLSWGNSDYKIFTKKATWKFASRKCNKLGMHLVAPGTPEENAFLHKYLEENNLQDTHYWIGLNDFEKEDEWVWIEQCRAEWTNWNPKTNEPNDAKTGEDCAIIIENPPNRKLERGKWNDIACTRKMGFICEKEKCPKGWIRCGCQCYKFVRSPKLNWDDAKKACPAMDQRSYLLQVDGDDEWNCLQNIIDDDKNRIKSPRGSKKYWTSGHMQPQIFGNNSGTWYWGDNTPIEEFHWGKREPNFLHNSEFCINLLSFRDYMFNDSRCMLEQGYVCERPV